MRYFGFGFPGDCLDEEFDAPDVEGDRELCRAIIAGRAGLHPEAWSNRSQLTTVMPLGFHGYEWVPEAYRRPIARSAAAIAEQRRENTEWEARHRRRPVAGPKRPVGRPRKRKLWPPIPVLPPVSPASWWVRGDPGGVIQLDCDDCSASFKLTAHYGRGERDAKAALLRTWGRADGWTHIAGRDRCPRCSCIPVPENIGDGAGEHQGDEQHGHRGQQYDGIATHTIST